MNILSKLENQFHAGYTESNLPVYVAFRRDVLGWHVVEFGSNWLKRKYQQTPFFVIKTVREASQITDFRRALLRVDNPDPDLQELLVEMGMI